MGASRENPKIKAIIAAPFVSGTRQGEKQEFNPSSRKSMTIISRAIIT